MRKLEDLATKTQYQHQLNQELQKGSASDLNEQWGNIKRAILVAAEETIGLEKHKSQDWFDENDTQIREIIDKKRKAKVAWENAPRSRAKEREYRTLKSQAQREIRQLQNDWWIAKANEIQGYADRNETRKFYEATRKVFGPIRSTATPIKAADGTVLQEQAEILNRWKDHFETLLNSPATNSRDFADSITQRPIRPEMDMPPNTARDTSGTEVPEEPQSSWRGQYSR